LAFLAVTDLVLSGRLSAERGAGGGRSIMTTGTGTGSMYG
jgi:hypothetical protein